MDEDQKREALSRVIADSKKQRLEELGLSAPDQISRDMIQTIDAPQNVRDALSPSADDIQFDPLGAAGTVSKVGQVAAAKGAKSLFKKIDAGEIQKMISPTEDLSAVAKPLKEYNLAQLEALISKNMSPEDKKRVMESAKEFLTSRAKGTP